MTAMSNELLKKVRKWISDADELTPYAVTTRYPGIDDRVTRKDALYAIELAKKVRKVVRRVLRAEGLFN